MEMCSRSSYSARTRQLLLLKRDGLSHEGFISMVITVSCHLQMPTHGCQMLVPGQSPLYFFQPVPYLHLQYSYWPLHSELCLGQTTNAVCCSRTFQNFPYGLDCNKAYGSPSDGVECVDATSSSNTSGVQVHHGFSQQKSVLLSIFIYWGLDFTTIFVQIQLVYCTIIYIIHLISCLQNIHKNMCSAL